MLVWATSSCVSRRAMAVPGRHQSGRSERTPCGSSWWWSLQSTFPMLPSGGPLPFDWWPTQTQRQGDGGPLGTRKIAPWRSAASRGNGKTF